MSIVRHLGPICKDAGVGFLTLALIAFIFLSDAVAQPLLQISVSNTNPQLVISDATGGVHLLQCAEVLADDVWRVLTCRTVTNGSWNWVDTTPRAETQRYYRVMVLTNNFPTNPNPSKLVWIPPGSFKMGDSSGLQTVVTITNGFFMDRMLVTQRDYLAIMGSNPSWFNGDRTPWGYRDYGINLDRPVETVNTRDATNYLVQLTQLEQQAGRLPAGWSYRLPSEAEWEYACRGGTTTRFFFGDDPSYTMVESYAWYSGNSGYVTQTVGTKPPNPWGLYDMSGNVKEWCIDVYPTSAYRAVRGGSCIWEASYCQSAFREGYHWAARANDCGLRGVLALTQP